MMRTTRKFPQDYEALRTLVHQAAGNSESVVMQAGHFLLHFDEVAQKIIPCLPEDLAAPRHAAIQDYAQFPILTWKLGLRLMASLPPRRKHVMVVVNDWQYLPKGINRAAFYAATRTLPGSYQEDLALYNGQITLLEPTKVKNGISTAPFFGEMNLRNRYQRHVSNLIEADKLPPSAVLQTRDKSLFCSLPDLAGVHREVYCSGKTGNCTGEIAEMIYEATARTGATCFINLYPLVCREFVECGSQLAVDLLASSCKVILNLGFQSTAIRDSIQLIETTEATLHQQTDTG